MSAPLRFKFVTSADDVSRLPGASAEVAFLGRSNVGKSSLLNALANRTGLAHTSKSPGRTRLLNLYELGNSTTAVDLPGYGFAAASNHLRDSWQEMVEGYLIGREPLTMVLLLVDGEIGPTPLDVQMLAWLRHHDLPHTVVASKLDKVKSSARLARRTTLAAGCDVEPDDVVWVSAAKGDGIASFRGLIMGWLAAGATAAGSRPVPRGAVTAGAEVLALGPGDGVDDEHEWN